MSCDGARTAFSPLAIFLVLAGLLLVPGTPGQAQETPAAAVRAFYVPTTPLGEDEESLRFAGIIDEALRRELELSGLQLILTEAGGGEPGAPEAGAGPLGAAVVPAREAEATIVVGSTAYVERRQLVMTFRAIDVLTERTIEATFVPTLVGVTVHNRIDEAVSALASRLEEFLETPEERATISPFALSVTLIGRPDGMEVSYPDGESLGRMEGGELELPFEPFPIGSRLLLSKTHPDYHPDEETIELFSPINTIELDPLWKKTRWAGELFWTTGQLAGLGLGVRYFFHPDYWFVAGENYFYLQPSPYENANRTSHNDLAFWTGRYLFFDHDSPFRLGAGIGLGTIFTRIQGADRALFTDFYLNLLTVWLEYNTRQWTYFFRMANKVSLGIGNNLLGSGYIGLEDPDSEGDGGMPQMTIGVGRKF